MTELGKQVLYQKPQRKTGKETSPALRRRKGHYFARILGTVSGWNLRAHPRVKKEDSQGTGGSAGRMKGRSSSSKE